MFRPVLELLRSGFSAERRQLSCPAQAALSRDAATVHWLEARDFGSGNSFRELKRSGIQPQHAGIRSRLARLLAAALLMFAVWTPRGTAAADTNEFITAWLTAQANLRSWSADVTQTRTLRTLTQPLVARGRLWFVAPDRFRWELGQPPQTIAVRQPDQMLVIYPRLRRVERFPLNTDKPAPWKEMLSLLEAGFPRSAAEIEARFKILAITATNEVVELALQPRPASARRLMPEVKLVFFAHDPSLLSTELLFADGSRLRNDFTNAQRNPDVPASIFTPEIPSSFKVVQPGGAAR